MKVTKDEISSNLTCGPAVLIFNHRKGWALPGRDFTQIEAVAETMVKRMAAEMISCSLKPQELAA